MNSSSGRQNILNKTKRLHNISCSSLSTSLLRGFRRHQNSNRNDQRRPGPNKKMKGSQQKRKTIHQSDSVSIKHKLVKNSSTFSSRDTNSNRIQHFDEMLNLAVKMNSTVPGKGYGMNKREKKNKDNGLCFFQRYTTSGSIQG